MHLYPWRDEEFRNRVNEWAAEKILDHRQAAPAGDLRRLGDGGALLRRYRARGDGGGLPGRGGSRHCT